MLLSLQAWFRRCHSTCQVRTIVDARGPAEGTYPIRCRFVTDTTNGRFWRSRALPLDMVDASWKHQSLTGHRPSDTDRDALDAQSHSRDQLAAHTKPPVSPKRPEQRARRRPLCQDRICRGMERYDLIVGGTDLRRGRALEGGRCRQCCPRT